MRIYKATHKPTGRSYRFVGRFSWGKPYYSCDLANASRRYFPKLKAAREHAERLGVLSIVEEPREPLASSIDSAEIG